jgi:hypothetical protein
VKTAALATANIVRISRNLTRFERSRFFISFDMWRSRSGHDNGDHKSCGAMRHVPADFFPKC